MESEKVPDSLSICCITFNMQGKVPTDNDLHIFLKKYKEKDFDIYMIGTEECYRSILVSIVYWDKSDWEEKVHTYLGKDEYDRIASQTLGAIHIIGFIKKSRKEEGLYNIGTGYKMTGGIYNILPNKGGVYIYFKFKQKSFLFINAHLAAYIDKNEKRIQNFKDILDSIYVIQDDFFSLFEEHQNLSFFSGKNLLNIFSFSIFMGDLNSRTDCGIDNADPTFLLGDLADFNIKDHMETLKKIDQLTFCREMGTIDMNGFKEAPITFPPTFKCINGSREKYDIKPDYIPSFTDRILYKLGDTQKTKMNIFDYESNKDVLFSDHKPVILTYVLHF